MFEDGDHQEKGLSVHEPIGEILHVVGKVETFDHEGHIGEHGTTSGGGEEIILLVIEKVRRVIIESEVRAVRLAKTVHVGAVLLQNGEDVCQLDTLGIVEIMIPHDSIILRDCGDIPACVTFE